MVNRTDPVEASPPGFFKVLEDFTPGMWLQLGALMGKLGDKEGMDPAELTRMVKNILMTQQKEGTGDEKKLASLIKILPSIENLPPEVVRMIEKMDMAPKLDQGVKTEQNLKNELTPKSNVTPSTEGPPKTDQLLRADNLLRQQMGKQELPVRGEFRSENAVKEVAKALNILSPPAPAKEVEVKPREDSHSTSLLAPKGGADAEFMAKNPDRESPELKNQAKQPKSDIPISLSEMKSRQSLEHKTIEKQPPSNPGDPRRADQPKSLAEYGLPKAGQIGTKPGESAPHSQAQQQPVNPEKTVIAGAPYATQLLASEARRKEKKKEARNPWDQEEDDEDSPEKKYPRE